MFKITGVLLEVSEKGSFEGTEYASIKVRSEQTGNKILKYKLDLKQVDYDAIAERLDTDVQLELDIVKGQNELAMLRVVGVK